LLQARFSHRSLLFHLLDLPETAHVGLLAVEYRAEERADQIGGEQRADDVRAETEDVHVVVLDALVGRVDVVADRGANSIQLAGRDGRSDARAADEDAALGLAVADRVPDLARLVRVVDP